MKKQTDTQKTTTWKQYYTLGQKKYSSFRKILTRVTANLFFLISLIEFFQ